MSAYSSDSDSEWSVMDEEKHSDNESLSQDLESVDVADEQAWESRSEVRGTSIMEESDSKTEIAEVANNEEEKMTVETEKLFEEDNNKQAEVQKNTEEESNMKVHSLLHLFEAKMARLVEKFEIKQEAPAATTPYNDNVLEVPKLFLPWMKLQMESEDNALASLKSKQADIFKNLMELEQSKLMSSSLEERNKIGEQISQLEQLSDWISTKLKTMVQETLEHIALNSMETPVTDEGDLTFELDDSEPKAEQEVDNVEESNIETPILEEEEKQAEEQEVEEEEEEVETEDAEAVIEEDQEEVEESNVETPVLVAEQTLMEADQTESSLIEQDAQEEVAGEPTQADDTKMSPEELKKETIELVNKIVGIWKIKACESTNPIRGTHVIIKQVGDFFYEETIKYLDGKVIKSRWSPDNITRDGLRVCFTKGKLHFYGNHGTELFRKYKSPMHLKVYKRDL